MYVRHEAMRSRENEFFMNDTPVTESTPIGDCIKYDCSYDIGVKDVWMMYQELLLNKYIS